MGVCTAPQQPKTVLCYAIRSLYTYDPDPIIAREQHLTVYADRNHSFGIFSFLLVVPLAIVKIPRYFSGGFRPRVFRLDRVFPRTQINRTLWNENGGATGRVRIRLGEKHETRSSNGRGAKKYGGPVRRRCEGRKTDNHRRTELSTVFAILYDARAVRWDYEIIIRDSFALPPPRSPRKLKINYSRFYRHRRIGPSVGVAGNFGSNSTTRTILSSPLAPELYC